MQTFKEITTNIRSLINVVPLIGQIKKIKVQWYLTWRDEWYNYLEEVT